MKKALSLLAALALSLSVFAGCAASSSSTPQGNSTAGTSAPQGNTKTTTIKFWHTWQGLEAKKFAEVISQFSAVRPDIIVEVLDSSTEEKQLISMTSGDSFDVGLTMDTIANKWSSKGALADMTPYIEANKTDMSNFIKPLLEIGQIDGKQYAVPFTMDTFMLLYNKDILAQAGFTAPPKTFEEFSEMCEAVTKLDANGDYERVGYVPSYPWMNIPTIPYAMGASLYDSQTNKILANSPEVIEAYNVKNSFFSGFYDNAKMIKFRSGLGQYQSAENPFFTGKVAFAVEGEWFPTFIKEYAPELNWDVAPMPVVTGKESQSGAFLQGGMLIIPEASKNKEAAYAFVEWLTSDAGQIPLCVAKGNLPSTYSGLKSEELFNGNASLKPFADYAALPAAKALPAVPFMGEYSTALSAVEDAMYNNQYTPQQAMEKVQKDIQPLADKWAKE